MDIDDFADVLVDFIIDKCSEAVEQYGALYTAAKKLYLIIKKQLSSKQMRLVIVSKDYKSIYDDEKFQFKISIKNIEHYLTENNFVYLKKELNRNDISDNVQIEHIIRNMSINNSDIKPNLLLIVDRRGEVNDTLFVTKYNDNDIKKLDILYKNYFAGMIFYKDSNQINKAYLTYGIEEKLRFFPEQLTTIVPRIFAKSTLKECHFLTLLYASPYKHGFCTDLMDIVFNDGYKLITNFKHVTVNYSRKYIKQLNENEEAQHPNKFNCNEFNVLNVEKCDHTNYIVKSLISLQNNNNNNNAKNDIELKINVENLTKAYDHIIISHQFCLNRKQRMKIQKYVLDKVTPCKYKHNCYMLDEHGSRRREIINKPTTDDVATNSNYNNESIKNDILLTTLYALHSYLIHGDKELFRLRCDDKNAKLRFVTANTFDDADDDIFGIDSINSFLNNEGMADIDVDSFNNWCKHNEYDTDSLFIDIKDYKTGSNLYEYFNDKDIDNKYFEAIFIKYIDTLSMDLLQSFLLQNGMTKDNMLEFNKWCDDNDYDTDSIYDDIEDEDS
eukprot:482191_1